MRGKLLGISAVAVLAAYTVATAGTIDLYLTKGSSPVPGGCQPYAVENGTLWIAPSDQNANLTAAYGQPTNYHKGDLYMYMNVTKRSTPAGTGCGNETVSSMGLDLRGVADASASRVTGISLAANSWTVYTLAADTGSAQNPWSAGSPTGPTLHTITTTGSLFDDSRAVAVPESTGSTLWNGYCPGLAYKVAKLTLQAGPMGVVPGGSRGEGKYDLFLKVGNLKITRVYKPGTGSASPEDVSFGRNGGSPDASTSGIGVGASSGIADATVLIRKKGDFGYVDPNTGFVNIPDGHVNEQDTAAFLGSFSTSDPELRYVGDFGYVDPNTGFVPTPDCQVNEQDTAAFLAAFSS